MVFAIFNFGFASKYTPRLRSCFSRGFQGLHTGDRNPYFRIQNSNVNNINDQYSGDQIEKNETDGARRKYGEGRGVCRVLVGIAEGKRPLGRTRRSWEDKLDLQ